MRAFANSLFTLILLTSGCRTSTAPKSEQHTPSPVLTNIDFGNNPLAIVGAKVGQFYFPIENVNQRWTWQTAKENEMEYEWVVDVRLDNVDYEFGYMRFCLQPNGKSEGTFTDLIKQGQLNVWKKMPDDSFAIQDMPGIAARQQGGGLLVDLTETNLLGKIMVARPTSLKFTSASPVNPQKEEYVHVEYR